jgi:hypothetical protein
MWNDNLIQFARLIAEMESEGVFTPVVIDKLKLAMDLETEDLAELVDRAQRVWDTQKIGKERKVYMQNNKEHLDNSYMGLDPDKDQLRDLIDVLNKDRQKWKPGWYYLIQMDAIECIWKETATYVDRIQPNLALHRDIDTKEVVGVQIGGVTQELERRKAEMTEDTYRELIGPTSREIWNIAETLRTAIRVTDNMYSCEEGEREYNRQELITTAVLLIKRDEISRYQLENLRDFIELVLDVKDKM